MAFPVDIKVKQEKKWEEAVIPTVNLDIAVKIENHQEDWCIGFNEESNNNENGYHDLMNIGQHCCRQCDSSFKNRYLLIQHNLKHLRVAVNRIYECEDCDNFFSTQNYLIHHRNLRHKPKNFISKSRMNCEICNKNFTYKNWHFHMNTVHSNKRLSCTKCHKKFKCKEYLNKHIRKRHLNDEEICMKTYSKKTSTNNTVKTVLNESCNCNQCDAVLNNKHALKTHIRNCHSESVTCELCGSQMKSKAYLLGHMRRIHKNKGHICPVCGKKIRSPTYLKLHLKNHDVKLGRVMKTRKRGSRHSGNVMDENDSSVYDTQIKCENDIFIIE